MSRNKLRDMLLMALLVAVEIILSRFLSINAWNMKIGFNFIPVVVAAILFGALPAGIVAAMGDFLGAILFPIGAYFPGFTLTAFLGGLVFGLFLRRSQDMKNIIPAVLINQLILGLCLNSLWISMLYGSPYIPLLITRTAQCLILIVVQVTLIRSLAPTLLRLGKTVFNNEQELGGKKELRRAALEGRRSLSEEQRREKSEIICRKILRFGLLDEAKTVFSYLAAWDEADMSLLHDELEKRGVRIAYPVSLGDGQMEAYIPQSKEALAEGRFGIKSPVPELSQRILPEEIDAVIMPCVGFDGNRNRLGHGGGYYDKYLSFCPDALMICVGFEAQRLKKIPSEEHDIKPRFVVTEKGMF